VPAVMLWWAGVGVRMRKGAQAARVCGRACWQQPDLQLSWLSEGLLTRLPSAPEQVE